MKILGRDCGCDARKALLRKILWPLIGIDGVSVGERLMVAEGHLWAKVTRKNGRVEAFDLGHNTITDAGVEFMVDDFGAGGAAIANLKYHAWGTGAPGSPPACNTTSLATEAAETRVAGTVTQPSANVMQSVAEITSASSQTIQEWGLLDQQAVGGTAWSVRQFTGIAVTNGDKIEFTYQLTISCVQG
jgi:hypothetical protein